MEEKVLVVVKDTSLSVFDKIKRSRDSSALKKHVEEALELMGQHEANGVAAGHPFLQSIWKKTEAEVAAYCKRWCVTEEQVWEQCPALTTLKSKADTAATRAAPAVGLGLIGAVVALFALPALWAVGHAIYVHVAHWLGG